MNQFFIKSCEGLVTWPDLTTPGPRKGVHPVDGEEPPLVTGMVHSYVNVVEGEGEGEERPALPARREGSRGRGGRRERRSKSREGRQGLSDYERIKEREKELERIHRRSR